MVKTMNLRDLRYLVALSEYRHFGKAAEACFVSQPALSMQIQKLEKDLGTALLERNNKSVLLTPIGKTITEKARTVLQEVDQIYEIAKLAEGPYSSELRIGIIPTLAPYLLPIIMPVLTNKLPKARFYWIEQQTEQLIQKLKTGTLDAALLAMPVSETSFKSEELFKEEFLVAVPPKHALSKRKNIKLNDLSNENVLLLEEGHCMRDQTLELCHQLNAKETQNFRATSLETLRHMVAAGNGITLMPKLAQQSNDSITYIPFREPKPMRTIGLYWRLSSVRGSLLTQVGLYIGATIRNITYNS
jgi:LysR family hydrogen peroxide-inducible transcriptional activator